ncbi:MAG: ATP-grasp domain-containing protein, partial [Firmicutes bacterium]|nr:ATP-grasp domain-containing protein [Bacillota bacterium]
PTTKKILTYHGLATPRFAVVPVGQEPNDDHGLTYPLFVKPAHEGSSMGISPKSKVKNLQELKAEVERVHRLYHQEALVEEYLLGREFTVGILGNENPKVFPIMEINFAECPPEHNNVYSRQFKAEWDDSRYYLCPAPLSAAEEERIKSVALAAYRALGCRDVSRVDLRLDQEGNPHVLEVNPLPGLTPGFSDLPRVAAMGGMSFDELILGILDNALERYGLTHLRTRNQEMIA